MWKHKGGTLSSQGRILSGSSTWADSQKSYRSYLAKKVKAFQVTLTAQAKVEAQKCASGLRGLYVQGTHVTES